MNRSRVVVADDHPIFVRGLVTVLEGAGFDVVGEAADGQTLLGLVERERPDIVVLDVSMPVLDGFGVLRAAREMELEVPILVLSLHQEKAIVQAALSLGARGWVVKDNAADEVVSAMNAVLTGRTWVSPSVDDKRAAPPGLLRLSSAELRVLALLADNLTSPQIAERLGLSVRTVQNHRAHACEKLGLTGSNRLLQFALENGERVRSLILDG